MTCFLGSVIKPNIVGPILLCFKYNLLKIFQNECSKSWYVENMDAASLAKCCISLIVLHSISKLKTWMLLQMLHIFNCFHSISKMKTWILLQMLHIFNSSSFNFQVVNMDAAPLAKCYKL